MQLHFRTVVYIRTIGEHRVRIGLMYTPRAKERCVQVCPSLKIENST